MHECMCIFLRRVCMHFDRCCEQHAWATAGVYVKQVLWTSVYTFAYTLATGGAYALMYVQFVHLALGNYHGGIQLVYESTCCLAWGVIFDTGRTKDRNVVCVISIIVFWTQVEVYVGVCVCIRAHTHTLHRWGTEPRCEPRSRDQTSGGPDESRWTKSRHIYIRICVQSTHVHVYTKGRDEIFKLV